MRHFLMIFIHYASIFPLSSTWKGVKRQRLVCLALMQGRLLHHRPIDPSVFFVQGDQTSFGYFGMNSSTYTEFHKKVGNSFSNLANFLERRFSTISMEFFHFYGIQLSTTSMKFNFPQLLWNSTFHKLCGIQLSTVSMVFNFPQILRNSTFHKFCEIQLSTISTKFNFHKFNGIANFPHFYGIQLST